MAYTGVLMETEGLSDLVDRIQTLERELKRRANGDLRQASKNIALEVVANRHQYLGRGAMVQVDSRIVDVTRVKYDRYVAVQVPGVKPKMSGLRKTNADRAKSLAVAVEWGSDYPALNNPPKGALVGRNIARLSSWTLPLWKIELARILRQYGLI